jgi:hypothetical protein
MSMSNRRIVLNSRARLAFDMLTRRERAALKTTVAPLIDLPEDRWPEVGAVRLESVEPMYFVRVDDRLRAILPPTSSGRPEILYFVRHELLERYFKEPADGRGRSAGT